MTIFDQIKEILESKEGSIVTSSEIKNDLNLKYGTNKQSIIPSDYCYNRLNNGIKFNKHLFEFINRNSYKYLGENYPYNGKIFHGPQRQKERVCGEWKNGIKYLYRKMNEPNS